MELKDAFCSDRLNMNFCLNRTFYGIESRMEAYIRRGGCVLIVPFMELKVDHDVLVEGVLLVLIVPFMELKDVVVVVLVVVLVVLIVPFMESKVSIDFLKQFLGVS